MIRKKFHVPLFLFSIGVIVAFLLNVIPSTKWIYLEIKNWGYPGSILAGILYAINVTSASATVILFNMKQTLNPIAVAIIGGFGALMYDLIVYTIFHHESENGWGVRIKELFNRHRWPRWLVWTVGGLIFASPLPDELASGLFALNNISRISLIIFSFLANSIGIFIIAIL